MNAYGMLYTGLPYYMTLLNWFFAIAVMES